MSNDNRDWSSVRKLYTGVVNGAGSWINSTEDAVGFASILRALADELDPDNTPRPIGIAFVSQAKKLLNYSEESE
jgi:hypothetical protein